MEPLLEEIKIDGYYRVIKVSEPKSKLIGIIAIHDTTLGPGVGGIRFREYETFDDALTDVLRLAKGMTYKFAMLPCNWGGAKSVVIADPKKKKNPELLLAFGRAIEKLKGSYIGAEDSGCTTDDLDIIKRETSHVIGLNGGAGNPAPFTAWGTFRGIQAALFKRSGSSSLEGRTVAIQGVGAVGSCLAEHLFWHGAQLIISDIDHSLLKRVSKKLEATVCPPEKILEVHCDILAPCAYGGIINKDIIPHLNCKVVAGAANNQLLSPDDAILLANRDILYAPDFVINGGGALNCVGELEHSGYSSLKVRAHVDRIYNQLLKIFHLAEENVCSTHEAAVQLANIRLKKTFTLDETSLKL